MEKQNCPGNSFEREKFLFDEINSIVTENQTKNINSHIVSFIRQNTLYPVKEGEKKNYPERSWGVGNFWFYRNGTSIFPFDLPEEGKERIPLYMEDFSICEGKELKDYFAGKHNISFYPDKKELKIIFPGQWILYFKCDFSQKEIYLKLLSPSLKLMNLKYTTEKDCSVKFVCGNYLITLSVYYKKIYLMVFDTDRLEAAKNFLLYTWEKTFTLYINKDLKKEESRKIQVNIKEQKEPEKKDEKEEDIKVPFLDPMSIEVGLKLLTLVDPDQGALLLERVKGVRRYIANKLGVIVPGVLFRDNLLLKHGGYAIKIHDMKVGEGEVIVDRYLAIGPAVHLPKLEGPRCVHPCYQMPGVWITADQRGKAEALGCMSYDPASVIAIHITKIIRTYAYEFIGRQEVAAMVETIKKGFPAIVKEAYPGLFTLGKIRKVLRNLLKEGISIKNLGTILEAMIDFGPAGDTESLTEYVREALGASVYEKYRTEDNYLNVIVLDQALEEILKAIVKEDVPGENAFFLQKVYKVMEKEMDYIISRGLRPVILTDPEIRLPLRRLMERKYTDFSVLGYNEIDREVKIKTTGYVSLNTLPIPIIKRKIKNISSNIGQSISRPFRRLKAKLSPEKQPQEKDKREKQGEKKAEKKDRNKKKHQRKLDSLAAWLDLPEVWGKIKEVMEKTGTKSYDAFTALHDAGYDVNGSVNYLLYGIMDESQADYFHLLFESHIWQKLDYIMESASCGLGQAFKFLVEFNEDELAAAEALKTGKT